MGRSSLLTLPQTGAENNDYNPDGGLRILILLPIQYHYAPLWYPNLQTIYSTQGRP